MTRQVAIIIALMLPICGLFSTRGAHAAEPTFRIFSDTSFRAIQKNDYHLGQFEEKLSENEILGKIKSSSFKKTDNFLFKFNHYLYFLYFIENSSDVTHTSVITLPGLLPETKLYVVKDDSLEELKRFSAPRDAFKVQIPPGLTQIVGYRFSKSNMQGKATGVILYDLEAAAANINRESQGYSLVFGAIVLLLIYNLGMYIFFRRSYFLYYVGYVATASYIIASFSGWLLWDLSRLGIVTALSSFLLIQFVNLSLSTRSRLPKTYRISWWLITINFLLGGYVFATGSWAVFMLMPIIGMPFCVFSAYLAYRHSFKPAIYLLGGWLLFFVSICFSLMNMHIMGWNTAIPAVPLGFTLEVALFSFAIAQKIRLSEQKALLETKHAFKQLSKVFYPHQIAKIKQGKDLEETMPTGKGEAVVISFDIISSSKLPKEKMGAFLELSIKSCLSIVEDSYQADRLQAKAYRIKELGDGFLCSVGFPFNLPEGSPCQVALELSLEFIAIFQKQVDYLLKNHEVYCSVALAKGELNAYFPSIGTKEYDVHGRGVILATRYEAMRKSMFPDGCRAHLITLHEAVFKELSASDQSQFKVLNLKESGFIVRDDEAANFLYYRLFENQEFHFKKSKSA